MITTIALSAVFPVIITLLVYVGIRYKSNDPWYTDLFMTMLWPIALGILMGKED